MKKYVPEVHVTGGRILASARDKAFLDKYLAEAGKPPIPIEVVEPGGARSARPRLH
jgi:hypothetical protein